jgi:hypothetical protein
VNPSRNPQIIRIGDRIDCLPIFPYCDFTQEKIVYFRRSISHGIETGIL